MFARAGAGRSLARTGNSSSSGYVARALVDCVRGLSDAAVGERGGFRLDDSFVSSYAAESPPFGFNGLGELVYRRTYSRVRPDGRNEEWHETVERVVNGTYQMQQEWMEGAGKAFDVHEKQEAAQAMYDRIFHMKFLPPGRGLWAMGSALTTERHMYAALNNCAFVSTDGVRALAEQGEAHKPFTFLMDMAMLGVGVGFDTKGAGEAVRVHGVDRSKPAQMVQIADSREGWVSSVAQLLNAYLNTHEVARTPVRFDYSNIRARGEPIRGFGGEAAGPQSLHNLHVHLERVLDAQEGRTLSSTTIVDIMNLIGKCIVTGNVRQTAEIAFGEPDDEAFANLKNYEVNPHRMEYGWTSNNSVFARLGMDYAPLVKNICTNGEPGFAWLDNMRAHSRMNGREEDWKDERARGGNPCLEQTLESYELCCLVETFPNRHDSLQEYKETLALALEYAKTVTLGLTHWEETNAVMARNRRIGCSMSGLAQFISQHGLEQLRQWCEEGYDVVGDCDRSLSSRFGVPESIKRTSIKPSGTVSLLAGATPGMHYPQSRYYIRRLRMNNASELLRPLLESGYEVEPAVDAPDTTSVVSFPVDCGVGVRTLRDVSMWEQLSLAAFLQRHWADNQVSCTVTFDPEREGPHIAQALDYFQYHLKGVSLLPNIDAGAYPQMPYEEIDAERYGDMLSKLKPLDIKTTGRQDATGEKYCDNDVCLL